MRKFLISLGGAMVIVAASLTGAQADGIDPDCVPGGYEDGICDMSWTWIGSGNPTPTPSPTDPPKEEEKE